MEIFYVACRSQTRFQIIGYESTLWLICRCPRSSLIASIGISLVAMLILFLHYLWFLRLYDDWDTPKTRLSRSVTWMLIGRTTTSP